MGDNSGDASSVTSYRLTGERVSPKRTRVDTGDATFVVGKEVNPVEYMLGAVVACLNSTGTMVARDMDVDIDELTMTVEGDVDYARYRGEETDARSGLQEITISLSVAADADEGTLQTWRSRVEDRCPVSDTVANDTPLSVELDRA